MFVRGSNLGVEYKRDDQSFYKGIVVKNGDPKKLLRTKVYISEISNQPLQDWLASYTDLNFRFPGTNNEQDAWSDAKIFEKISNFLPWAEPCIPLLGEHGPARYQSPEELAVITDGNYEDEFRQNDEVPPTTEEGSFGPSFFYENHDTNMPDAFADPTDNFSVNNNPYAYQYGPTSHVNEPKGVFGVPNVGAQVWVFHYRGDLNFPVYFGGRHDYRENILITNSTNPEQQSLDYPGVFENAPKQNPTIE